MTILSSVERCAACDSDLSLLAMCGARRRRLLRWGCRLRGDAGDPHGAGGGGAAWRGPAWRTTLGVEHSVVCEVVASTVEGAGTHAINGFSLGGGMAPDLK
jgi:hypothetical protein